MIQQHRVKTVIESQMTVNVNGTDYLINKFKGKEGLMIGAKISKLIAPLFAASTSNGEELDITKIADYITDKMDEDSVCQLIVKLMTSVYKGSQQVNFDTEFAGNYATLFDLIKEVVMFNYSDVFSKLGTRS